MSVYLQVYKLMSIPLTILVSLLWDFSLTIMGKSDSSIAQKNKTIDKNVMGSPQTKGESMVYRESSSWILNANFIFIY